MSISLFMSFWAHPSLILPEESCLGGLQSKCTEYGLHLLDMVNRIPNRIKANHSKVLKHILRQRNL